MVISLKGLIYRNIKVYFNDKGKIFFSILTPIIVLLLYSLFLAKNYDVFLENIFNEFNINKVYINKMISALILSSTLGVTLITVPFQCTLQFLEDKDKKIILDLSATGLNSRKRLFSYIISSAVSSIIVSIIIFSLSLIIFGVKYDMQLAISQIIYILLLILLGSISAVMMFLPIIILFKNLSSANGIYALVSSISGFVIGAYIPLTQFSSLIQSICSLFPATEITALIKKVLLSDIINEISLFVPSTVRDSFSSELKKGFSINNYFNGYEISIFTACIIIFLGSMLFYILLNIFSKIKSIA